MITYCTMNTQSAHYAALPVMTETLRRQIHHLSERSNRAVKTSMRAAARHVAAAAVCDEQEAQQLASRNMTPLALVQIQLAQSNMQDFLHHLPHEDPTTVGILVDTLRAWKHGPTPESLVAETQTYTHLAALIACLAVGQRGEKRPHIRETVMLLDSILQFLDTPMEQPSL